MLKNKVVNTIKRSINIKLSIWIAVSLVISIVIGVGVIEIIEPLSFLDVKHVDYDRDRYDTEQKVLDFINNLYKEDNYDDYIEKNIKAFDGNIYIVNREGKVEYKNINDGYSELEQVNIEKFKKENMKTNKELYKICYPLTMDNQVHYLLMIKELNGIPIYSYEIKYAIAGIISLVLFVLLIYFGIRKKVKYIEYISSSISEIAKGNLNYQLEIKGEDELASVSNQINLMEKNLLTMIDKERENDKLQRELITNISHDLKTPLTIILGYLDIIKTKAYKTEGEKEQYIERTYEKALVLQKMILKLFELVKLNDKETALNRSEVNINKLLKQTITDYLPMADGKNIKIEYENTSNIATLNVDLEKICRVFNNLINNAIKYSEENQTIKIGLEDDDAGALIYFRNKCNNIKEKDLDKLFNRFYRGDKARNSAVEGSGIGLSIVKKIMELHNSSIWAELHGDEICFIIRLRG